MRTGPDPAPLVGDVVETVLVGPVLAGHVALWDSASEPGLWRVDEPEEMAPRVGRGLVARSEVEPRRFREAGLFSRAEHTLLLPARHTVGGNMATTSHRLHPVGDVGDAVTGDAWGELIPWLADVVEAAFVRGDFVVVELGGYDFPPEPYALAILQRDVEGAWVVVETQPVPSASTVWPEPEPGAQGVTVRGEANDPAAIRASAHFLAHAAGEWVPLPWLVGVTFGRPRKAERFGAILAGEAPLWR